MTKLLIIDTFNFFHRAYYALPVSLTDPSGKPVNAVYGVASMLINIFDLIQPDYVVAALESKEKTERKKQYEEYKAQRKPMDDELKDQIPLLFELLEGFNLCMSTVSGYEGDDVVASLVQKYSDEMEIVIASNDRDLWQLVGDGVMVMSPRNNGKAADWVGPREVYKKYGFGPKTILDYKALVGDSSDNIPGVRGVGKVTATKLLLKYGSLNEIYAHLDEIAGSFGKSVGSKLSSGKEDAFLSYDLAQLQGDLDLDVSLDECAFSGLDKDSVREVLEKYAFYSLLKRLDVEGSSEDSGGSPSSMEADTKDSTQLSLF